MESGYLEILVRMLGAIQAHQLNHKGTAASGRGALSSIRSIAREAPAGLKEMRPSLGWDSLAQLRAGRSQASAARRAETLRNAEAAILEEFHILSGKLVHYGRTGSSFAAVFDAELNGGPARCLYLDGTLSSAERPGGVPALFYQPIAASAFSILKGPKRGLVIGVAGGTLIEMLKKEFPSMHVDGVDIDAGAFEMGKKFFSLREDSRTHLHAEDGRTFIRKANAVGAGKYDIVIVDAFRGLSPVPSMVTREFALEVKASLRKGGVCVINTIAAVERGGYLQYLFNTWRSVFRNVVALPLCNEGEIFNVVLVATDADCRRFIADNARSVYGMDYDEGLIFTDADNPVSYYSPY